MTHVEEKSMSFSVYLDDLNTGKKYGLHFDIKISIVGDGLRLDVR